MSSSSYGYSNVVDSSGASNRTAADLYESAGTVSSSSSSGVPGKYFKVEVPDFTVVPASSSSSSLHSYLRLGAVNPSPGGDVGEDLADAVGLNDPLLHTFGGWRDHTDGNRITTTRGDKIEVVGGQHRLLVNAGQALNSGGDPTWVEEDDEDVQAFVEHIYADTYYEVIRTTGVIGFGSSSTTAASTGNGTVYAQPRSLTTALVPGDFYEYTIAGNLTEIAAASGNLIEKVYGQNAVLEVTSTLHAAYADWETLNYGPSYVAGSATSTASPAAGVGTTQPSGPSSPALLAGDLVDYMFAENFTEVIRARDLLVDKIYGDRLLEVVATRHINDRSQNGDYPWEPDPGALQSGDLFEYINGDQVQEIIRADHAFVEIFEAVGGDLVSTMRAPSGTLTENINGSIIVENYNMAQSMTETTTAYEKNTTNHVTHKSETLTTPSRTSVTFSALAGDISAALFKASATIALLHAEIKLGVQSVETGIGIDLEIKNLQLKLVMDHATHGLKLKTYAGVCLFGV